jgi:hypothetical protein
MGVKASFSRLFGNSLKVLASCAIGLVSTQFCLGFAHAQPGDLVDPVPLPDPEGNMHPFIGESQANLFIFFNPEKKHSRLVLEELSELKKKLAGEPVSWTAILSDRFSVEDTTVILHELGLDILLLIDEGDELFGKLGVALYPVIGITDANHVLRHYLHFRKVNFPAIIEGALQEVLGNLSEEQFQRILRPAEGADLNKGDMKKGARLGLARRLIQAGKLDKAEAHVRVHLADWPGDEPAIELLQTVLDLKKDASSGEGDPAGNATPDAMQ